MNDDLMTPAEVAATFHVHSKTVLRWAAAGRLTSIRTPGGHRRYRRSQVEAILSDETQAAITAPYVIPQRPALTGKTWTIERLPDDVDVLEGLPEGSAGRLAVVERKDGVFVSVAQVAPDDDVQVSYMEGAAAMLAHVFGGEVADARIGGAL